MSEIQQIEQHLTKWVEQFIISLNICPFAKAVFPKQTLIKVCPDSEFELVYDFLTHQIEYLLSQDENTLSTSIIATPYALQSFDEFLDMLDVLEHALEQTGLDSQLQIAPFHPNFEFDEGEAENPATLKTNQSPYPLFHLLRVKQVEQVLTSEDTAEKIVLRNKQILTEMGEEKLNDLFDSFKK